MEQAEIATTQADITNPEEILQSTLEETENSDKPEWLAEKFWDGEKGEIRTESLARSYAELEKRFSTEGSGPDAGNVPASIDEYEIMLGDEKAKVDEAVAERLHKAGFTREQAQVVYDLGVEQLAPVIMELAANAESEKQISKLESHFGGRERWGETARQINAWGQANLGKETFDTLSASYDGVIAMHRMMAANEPTVIGRTSGAPTNQSEGDLRRLMRDPKYWRERDPAVVSEVRNGFAKLYPAG